MSSLKINFFPLHFIISILALIVLVVVFSNDVYIYMSSNIYINGLIIVLFFICMFWIFGVLSYYSRSAKVLSKLLSLNSKKSFGKGYSKEEPRDKAADRKRVAEVSAAVAGTLIDTPVISKAIAFSTKNGRVEINAFDSANILDSVSDSGDRVLGLSRFLTSVFTMLGLAGTFIGLLQTIDGVGKALGSLSNIQNVDILGFVKLLADPLQGMSVAFSTSLFGLAAALFGNYGNYVATQSLSVFVHKLKTVLQATAGISSLDPNKIEAKDILIALDDSFNRLYEGLSDRLDVVSESMMSMVKVIARTNERQERVLKVVVDNFASMEEVWSKILNLTQEVVKLPSQVDAILANNRNEFFNYFDSRVVPIFDNIAIGVSRGVDVSSGILGATQGVLNVSQDTNIVSKEILGTSGELLGATGQVISGISTNNAIAGDLVGVASSGNEISNAILSATADGVAVSRDIAGIASSGNEISNAILSATADGVAVSRDIAGIASSGNEISNAILSATADGVAVSRDIAGITSSGNEISNAILSATADGVAVSRDIAGITSSGIEVVGGMLNNIAQLEGQILQSQAEATAFINQSTAAVNESTAAILHAVKLEEQILSVNQSLLNEVNNGNNLTSSVLGELGVSNNLNNSILSELSNSNNLSSAVLGELGNSNGMLSGLISEVSSGNNLSNSILDQVNNSNALSSSLLEVSSTGLQIISGVASSLDKVSNSVDSMNSQLDFVGQNMVNAVQSFAENSNVAAQELSALRQSFDLFTTNVSDIIQGFQFTVNSVADASSVVANLEQSVSSLNNSFYSVIPVLEQIVGMYDQNAISNFLSSLDAVNQSLSLVSQSIQDNSSQSSDAVSTMSGLINEVSLLRSDFAVQLSDVISSLGDNLSTSNSENLAVLDQIRNEMMTLNDNNVKSVSDTLLNNILNASENNGVLLADLTQAIQDLSSANADSNERAIDALLALRDEASHSNARLDIVAASVDALITEILNSRDVAQSILDLVAKMNDYNKIN